MDPILAMTLAGMGMNIVRGLLASAHDNPNTKPEQREAIFLLLAELTEMADRVEGVLIKDV